MARSVLRELATIFTLEAENFNNGIKAAQKEAKEFEKTIKPSKDLLKDMGTAFTAAGGAVTAAMIGMVKVTADYGAEINKVSMQTGIGAEALSELKFAADQSETSFEGVANGLKILSRNAAEAADGSKAQVAAFKEIGVSVKDSTGALRPMNDLLLDVADRFSVMEDGTAKAALAQKIFGKSGMDLIPILNEGRAGILAMGDEAERLGLVMSQEVAAAADQFDDTLTQVKAAATGLSVSIGQALLPSLTRAAEEMRDGIATVTDFAKEHQGLTQAVAGTAAAITGAGGLALGLAAVGTVAPKVVTGIQAIAVGAKLARTEIVAMSSATMLLTGPGAVKSYGDLASGVSLLGESSKLAKVGLVGLAGAAGIAVGELINFGVEAVGLQQDMDALIASLARVGAEWLPFQTFLTQGVEDQQQLADITEKAAAVLSEKYGVALKQGSLSTEEFNRQVMAELQAHQALDPAIQASVRSTNDFKQAQQDAAEAVKQQTAFMKNAIEQNKAYAQEMSNLKRGFLEALKPADDLEKELRVLIGTFGQDLVLANERYRDQIIQSVEAQHKNKQSVSDLMGTLYMLAQQMKDTEKGTDALKMRIDSAAGGFKGLGDAATGAAAETAAAMKAMTRSISDPISELQRLGIALPAGRNISDPIGNLLPPQGAGETEYERFFRQHAGGGALNVAGQPAIPANFNIGGLSPGISGQTLTDVQRVFRDWFPGAAPINLPNTRPDLGLPMTAAQIAAMGPRGSTPSVARFGATAAPVTPVQMNTTNNFQIQTQPGMDEQQVATTVVRMLETNQRGFLDKTTTLLQQASKGTVSKTVPFG